MRALVGAVAGLFVMSVVSTITPVYAAPAAKTSVRVCGDATTPGFARCLSQRRTDPGATGHRPSPGKRPVATPDTLGNAGAYDPSYLQSAYNLASASASGGAGTVVAVVDAYDSPTAESDLDAYRSHFGLAPCPAGSCFNKVDQNGGTSYPAVNTGWAQEISLDLDMVSAICPGCGILLVEATTNSLANLGTAVNTAARLGATAISNSYGGSEFSSETTYDSQYYNHPGIAVTASTGDKGYGVEYPAASPYLTAVGGTTLNQLTNTGARNATETAWSGAGSGCSAYEAKPTWQTDAGCSRRSVGDVSAVADPNTGVWVYFQGAWYVFGGTSVASPIIASVFALNGKQSVNGASAAYSNTGALNDIVSGSNGSCGTYLCTAGTGYDGPTGLGTPNGTAAFAVVPPTPDFSVAVSPSSQSVGTGTAASYTVTVAPANGFSGSVALTLSGQPADAVYSFTPSTLAVTSPSASSSTLSISTATAGSYTLLVTAGSGSLSHASSATLVASTPDFSLSASPSSAAITQGGTASYSITVAPTGGFTGSVNLSVSGAPADSTPLFSQNPVSVAGSTPATTTLSLASSTIGTYTLTISGSAGSVHTTTVTLVVNAPAPDFTVSISPSSQTVSRGGTTSYAVTITPINGFSGPVDLTVSGLPRATSASFSPNPATTSSTLTLTTGRKTWTGSYPLTITASGGGVTHTVVATLLVQ